MFKYAFFALFVTVIHSLDKCSQNEPCSPPFKCKEIKVGPVCDLEQRCTYLNQNTWKMQTCDCTHLNAGVCMIFSSQDPPNECSEMGGEMVTDICLPGSDITEIFQCCSKVTDRICKNDGGECHHTKYDCKAPKTLTCILQLSLYFNKS